MGYVVDKLVRVLQLVCRRGWRGWRTKVNSVSDIGGNIGGELDSIVWVAHYFSNSFQKLAGNEYSSKVEK